MLKSLYVATLVFALFLEAGVLYFLEAPTLRLALGLALLLPITWMVARTRVVEAIGDVPIAIRRRQFGDMRSHMVLLLDEVRRLNWMAVDEDRGFRDQDQATEEIDAIEKCLHTLVGEIRRTAGRASVAHQALVSETSQAPKETGSSAPDYDG